jgi:signal transduction histidine kinase
LWYQPHGPDSLLVEARAARRRAAKLMAGWRRFAKWVSSSRRGSAIVFLKRVFGPPPAFETPGDEPEFLADHAARFATHRRSAVLLALILGTTYSGWDFFFGFYNEGLRQTLLTMLPLRSLGAAYLAAITFILVRSTVVNDERGVTYLISSCVCVMFLMQLLTTTIAPFPSTKVVHLALIMTVTFGLARLRARVVLLLNVYCLAASSIILPFAKHDAEGALSSLYVFYSLSYLFVFAVVGSAVAVELERTARDAFLRERALADSERRTQVKTAALVETKEKLRHLAEQRDIAKSRFLAEAAHDLRQPMQALMNLLEAGRHALAREDVDRCGELLEQAQHAAQSARSSFNAVLELSQLESGFVRAEHVNFDIQELVNDVVSPLRALAEIRGVKFRLRRCCGENLLVRSDRHLLERVLSNLISNAVKYSDPAKGDRATVIVGIVRLPDRVRVDIVDNGVGIAKDQWDTVFKPFVQLRNPGRDRDKGVGLGLSIVDAIVELLSEHRLDMNSVPGRGTRFSVTVPRAKAAAEAEYLGQIRRTPAMSPVAGAYVLYVEDDVLVRNSTISMFEEHQILYEAFSSLDGMEDRLRSLERVPDLLITDFLLPDGHTGEDVLRMVDRALAATLPAIIISGEALSSEQQNRLSAATTKPARILLKPVAPEVLMTEISLLCAV